ncbi:MAG: outer membrane beta-barrel protein [Candidatus Eisenbacteria bacterium]|nr:outer membrane beta-barrel protein [Candidatus Eisenbacteria bacterium]
MRLLVFVAAFMLVAGVALGAEVPTMKGDKAMVFMFDGLDDLDLDSYAGGIGMRYYFGDYMAIRGGVMFDMYSETEEPCSDAPDGYPDYEYSSSAYGIELVFEKHLEGCSPSVSPYFGVGGYFRMMSSEEKDPTATEDGYGTDVCTEDYTYLGLFGALGFEWAFTDCMTLGGEYTVGFQSMSGEEETDYAYEGVDTETCEESGSWMGFDEASVYLSVYW